MKESIRAGKMENALRIADEINPTKVKNNSDLGILADLYLENGKLKRGSDCLMELYSRKKTRSILMQLVNLSIRVKKVEAAERFFHEFREMAPNDFYNYIFRYNIDKLKGKSIEVLISDLEKLKKVEYIESWAYELAKLYHKAGEKDKCIAECNDIEIWFGDGEYVDRARALREYYTTGALNIQKKDRVFEEEAESAASYSEDSQAVSEEALEENRSETEEREAEVEEDIDAHGEEVFEITASLEGEDDSDVKVATDAAPQEEAGDTDEGFNEIEPEIGETSAFVRDEDMEEIEVTPEDEVETVSEEEAEAVSETEPEDETKTSFEHETESEAELIPESKSETIETAEAADEVMPATIEAAEQLEAEGEEALIMKLLAEGESALASAVNMVTEDDLPKKAEEIEVPIGEMQLVEHEFKGVKDAVIAEDSLLAKFLSNENATLEDYFGYFAYQADVRQQLIKVLEIMLNTQIKNKCLAITGDYNSGIKVIIRGITKILFQSGFLTGKQVACVDCEKFNTMRINEKDERLAGCCLTIKSAGRITASAVDKLMKVNESLAGKTAVILTDGRTEINRLFRDNRELNSMFPQRVHMPAFDLEDFIDMLFVHMNDNGLSICQEAYDEVLKELKVIQKINRDGGIRAADTYIRAIIDVVETRKAKKLISDNFAIRSDEHENVITVDDVKKAKA